MIKVEIKPVYKTNSASTVQQEDKIMTPEYLEKTIKILGITIFCKRAAPIICPKGGFEIINRF